MGRNETKDIRCLQQEDKGRMPNPDRTTSQYHKSSGTIRYFSMFTGVGGFELGLQRNWTSYQKDCRSKQDILLRGKSTSDKKYNSFTCIGFSEIDKYSNQLLAKRFPDIPNFGDCTKINPSKLPDFDMLCGGFPCQSFSIAGKRRGFQDTRGTMFFEIARILEVKKPRLVFLENVKGLLNHDKGKTFRTIIQSLSELGYDVQWMVLNSKFFGVPQNRERLFIIGSLRGTSRQEILPFRSFNSEINKSYKQMQMIESPRRIRDTQKSESFITSWNLNLFGDTSEKEKEILECWRYNHRSKRYGDLSVGNGMSLKELQEYFNYDITLFLKSILDKGYLILKEDNKYYCQNCRKVQGKAGFGFLLNENSWSPTITSSTLTENAVISNENNKNEIKIRKLTPVECERLQGFPDNWTEEFSDTQRYKMMGNAVTVNVIKAIAEKLK